MDILGTIQAALEAIPWIGRGVQRLFGWWDARKRKARRDDTEDVAGDLDPDRATRELDERLP